MSEDVPCVEKKIALTIKHLPWFIKQELVCCIVQICRNCTTTSAEANHRSGTMLRQTKTVGKHLTAMLSLPSNQIWATMTIQRTLVKLVRASQMAQK